jgi:hypothetical protein
MIDYIPRKDAELVRWSTNFATKVSENISEWRIPNQEIDDLQAAVTDFTVLHTQADSPAKTAIIVAEKNAARKTLVALIRGLVNFYLKNPIITDAQRIAMGLHVRDTTLTIIPAPASRPEFEIEVLDLRRLKVGFRDMGSTSKAKPHGVNNALIFYAVLDTPPASPDVLTRFALATRTPFTLEFTESERGKTVYVAICWQNAKGEKGPMSEMESAIVP